MSLEPGIGALVATWRSRAGSLRRYAPEVATALEDVASELEATLAAGHEGAIGAAHEMPAEPAVGPPPDRLLTVAEAALRLGVTKDWLYRHWEQIPGAVKLGRRQLRFSAAKLDRYVETRRRSAA